MPGQRLFSWLHLSDIHFGHGSEHHKLDQRDVWNKLTSDIQEAVNSGHVPRPNKIFITGDLAFSGENGQYNDLGTRLRTFARSLQLRADDILTVPGNHDAQRSIVSQDSVFGGAFSDLRSTGRIDEALSDQKMNELLESRFANYLAFCREFTYDGRSTYWTQVIKTRLLNIRVVGLNTAILANDKFDKGKLALGLKQLERAIPSDKSELVIALSHHPFREWLSDGSTVETRLRSHAHIHLLGHVHEPASQLSVPGGGYSWLQICASAVHTDESESEAVHGYNFASLCIDGSDNLHVEIWPRHWDKKNARFCIDSKNTDSYSSSAVHKLNRPKHSEVIRTREFLHQADRYPESAEGGVFDHHSIERIAAEIDSDMNRRIAVASESLRSVARRFRSLFMIDDRHLDQHPLFIELRNTLDSLVPGIVLNEEDGILRRANIRHAILRTETLHSILSAIETEKLREVAKEIGKHAAGDLINILDSGRHVPATARDFVALWDFWDRTGGWGKLFLPESECDDDKGIWRLHISNNFLEVDRERKRCNAPKESDEWVNAAKLDIEATHKLCEFWCGYIHGFLEESLPEIRNMMLTTSLNDSRGIFIPAYSKVETVSHDCLPDESICGDIFIIKFISDGLSGPIAMLSRARGLINDNPPMAVMCTIEALHSAASAFPEKFKSILDSTNNQPRKKRLTKAQKSQSTNLAFQRDGTPEEWLDDANWMIRSLLL